MSSWTRPASRRPTTLIGKRLKASHLYPFPVVAGLRPGVAAVKGSALADRVAAWP